MTTIPQSYLFSVLVAVTILPLDASSLLTLRQSNDPAASLKKCLKHLEKQQAGADSTSTFSRTMLPDDTCDNLLDHLLTRIQLLPDQRSELRFGSGNEDPRLISDTGSATGLLYPNFGSGIYAKFESPKTKKDFPEKLANIRSNMLEDVPNNDVSNIFTGPSNLLLDKPTTDFIQKVPTVKNSLKTNSLLSKLVENGNLQAKTHYFYKNQGGHLYNGGFSYHNDDEDEFLQTQNEQRVLPRQVILPSKRSENWFNVVSTEVAKRRRQTLSINNALMALTDMVMEHGREKLMRNRDNLRYHMYVQG